MEAREIDGKLWVLVPVEPTDDMIRAGWRTLRQKNDFQTRLGNSLVGTETPIYAAMISAAPAPPQTKTPWETELIAAAILVRRQVMLTSKGTPYLVDTRQTKRALRALLRAKTVA